MGAAGLLYGGQSPPPPEQRVSCLDLDEVPVGTSVRIVGCHVDEEQTFDVHEGGEVRRKLVGLRVGGPDGVRLAGFYGVSPTTNLQDLQEESELYGDVTHLGSEAYNFPRELLLEEIPHVVRRRPSAEIARWRPWIIGVSLVFVAFGLIIGIPGFVIFRQERVRKYLIIA